VAPIISKKLKENINLGLECLWPVMLKAEILHNCGYVTLELDTCLKPSILVAIHSFTLQSWYSKQVSQSTTTKNSKKGHCSNQAYGVNVVNVWQIDAMFQLTFLLTHHRSDEQLHHYRVHYHCHFDCYLDSHLSQCHKDTIQSLRPYNLKP